MSELFTPTLVDQLNAHLKAGGVIAFPTDTVWGLGALPTDQGANALYETKRRPRSKRLIIMSDTYDHIRPFMTHFPPKAHDLAARYWPGALTIARDGGDDWRGGVRVPNYGPFRELCRHIDGHCLATTSANLSGMETLQSADDIRATLKNVLVIDNATAPMGGRPSTVVVVSDDGTQTIVRAGAVTLDGARIKSGD